MNFLILFHVQIQIVCYLDGPMDNSSLRFIKESVVAFHILLAIVLVHINASCKNGFNETISWYYT